MLHPAPTVPEPEGLRMQVDRNTEAIGTLLTAVSDGIAHVNRHEKRIQKTVASARRLVAANGLEHPGLEAEAAELHEPDGDAGHDEQLMLPVQVPVEEDQRPSGIPGLSNADIEGLKQIGAF